MSKQKLPLVADDISAFARALSRQLDDTVGAPGHLTLMNMLARSGGYRNFQHLRSSYAAEQRLETPVAQAPIDFGLVERALNQFDQGGRLTHWPSRRSVRDLCLWGLWSRFPAGRSLKEREVNAFLGRWHLFNDAAQLRRSLVEVGLVDRMRDCSAYLRVEQRPPGEALALARLLKVRAASA